MANSRYEYVRNYEMSTDSKLLQDCFIVVRVDGQSFHKFSKEHNFLKPNDKRCLDLMNKSALHVMRMHYPNIIMAFGHSDEYSFVFRRLANIFNRRQNKIVSLITSAFTSAFIFYWPNYFNHEKNRSQIFKNYQGSVFFKESLKYPVSFDGRCVLYPNAQTLSDYLRWRQVDCHINNLYNTTFHALTGQYTKYTLKNDNIYHVSLPSNDLDKCLSATEATKKLSGTLSGDKNEILFSSYGINYNNELEQFRKGTIITLKSTNIDAEIKEKTKSDRVELKKMKEIEKQFSILNIEQQESFFEIQNIDIIKELFWEKNKLLLEI